MHGTLSNAISDSGNNIDGTALIEIAERGHFRF